MKSIKYNKLVRDKIPEIIEETGKKCIVDFLDDQQYQDKLVEKLHEEIQEFQLEYEIKNKHQSLEELADLLEVVSSLLKAMNVDQDKFAQLQAKKKETNGGFEKRYFLKEVIEIEDSDKEQTEK